ncbi:hypothetical protein AKJ16_DCAP16409 [Drosera capensis]
MNEWMDG